MFYFFVKLREAWQEVEVARDRSQQLQAQVEELQEEVSLQDSRTHLDASLLSELEAADWGISKEQVQEFNFDNHPYVTERLAKSSQASDLWCYNKSMLQYLLSKSRATVLIGNNPLK